MAVAYFTITLIFNDVPHLNTGGDDEVDVIKPNRFFASADDYRYQPISDSYLTQARSMVNADPGANEEMRKLSAREVTQAGSITGRVLVFSVDPEHMEDASNRREGLLSVENTSGVAPQEVDIRGKTAYLFLDTVPARAIVYYENLIVSVISPSEETMRGLTTDLLNAQQ